MLKRLVRFFKFIVPFTFIGIVFWGGYKALGEKEPPALKTEVGRQDGMVSEALNIKITDKNGEGEVLKLTASEATVVNNVMKLKGIEAHFVSAKRAPIKISSKKGYLNQETDNAFFEGDVVVESQNYYTLKTGSLHWEAGRRLFVSDDNVEYSSQNSLILGKGIEIDVDNQNVTVKSSVDAVFN